jgi:hypothetical protein
MRPRIGTAYAAAKTLAPAFTQLRVPRAPRPPHAMAAEHAMAVTIARDLEQHLHETVVLLIRSDDPPSLVAAGVRAAMGDIATTGRIPATGEDVLAGEVIGRDGKRWRPTDQEWADDGRLAGAELPSYVADPVTIPGGQLLMIDYSSTPPRLCRQTPGILLRHLEAARVRNAQIGLAPRLSGRKNRVLGSLTPVAWARLRADVPPHPDGGLAAVPHAQRLIDVATGWLRGQSRPGMELLGLVISAGVPLTWDAVAPVVSDVLASGGYTTLVASDFRARAAVAVLGDLALTGVSLRAASAPPAVEQVAAAMRGQRDVIRAAVAEVGWAGVTAYRNPSPSSRLAAPDLAVRDEFGAGPMWYQVLSPAQLERLRALPPGAVELASGRFELTIGEPEQWVPGHRDHDAVRARARYILPI